MNETPQTQKEMTPITLESPSTLATTPPTPSTWLESLSSDFQSKNYNNIPTKDLVKASNASSKHELAAFAVANEGLAVATISSGTKGKFQILHHFSNLNDSEGKAITLALAGLGSRANIAEVDLSKCFGKTKVKVPSVRFMLESFTDLESIDNTPLNKDETIEVTSSNALFVPPKITEVLGSKRINNAKVALISLLDKERDYLSSLVAVAGDNDKLNLEAFKDDDIKNAELISHIATWAYLSQSKSQCTSFSDDPLVERRGIDLHESLLTMRKAPTQRQDQDESMLPESANSKRSALTFDASSPTPRTGNRVENEERLTVGGSNLLNDISQMATRNPTSNKQRRLNTSQNLTSQFDRDVRSGLPPPPPQQYQSNLEAQMSKLVQVSETYFNNMNTLATNQAQQNSIGKVHYTVENFLRRAGTEDGEDPAASITPLARELLTLPKSSKHIAHNLVQLALKNSNVKCELSPHILSSLMSGDLLSKKAFNPSPFSPYSCPSSFEGTTLEHFDLMDLKNRKTHGIPMSEKDREALENALYIVARSVTQLTKLIKGFGGVVAHYLGNRSLAARHINAWNAFIQEYEDRLSSITSKIDDTLPAKIQFLVSLQVEDFLQSASTDIPDQLALGSSNIQQSILQGNTNCITLPPAILLLLNPESSKKKQPAKVDTTEVKDKLDVHEHKNQDPRLKTKGKAYYNVIVKNGIHKRIFPDDGECAKFIFKGVCNGDCKRKGKHTTPKGKRLDNCVRYKEECLARYNENKKDGDPDFQ